jgi:hypothetical protein
LVSDRRISGGHHDLTSPHLANFRQLSQNLLDFVHKTGAIKASTSGLCGGISGCQKTDGKTWHRDCKFDYQTGGMTPWQKKKT